MITKKKIVLTKGGKTFLMILFDAPIKVLKIIVCFAVELTN
jgi:hypothetical protein